MGARLERLLNELSDRSGLEHLRCSHGGVLYPPYWNAKTQEQAIADGVLVVCDCEVRRSYAGYRYLIVKGV